LISRGGTGLENEDGKRFKFLFGLAGFAKQGESDTNSLN